MALLEDIKTALRVSEPDTDLEILDLIEACKLELSIAGVVNINDADALIKRAITVYVKANYGYDNQDAERFQKAYDSIKMHLSLSTEYNTAEVTT